MDEEKTLAGWQLDNLIEAVETSRAAWEQLLSREPSSLEAVTLLFETTVELRLLKELKRGYYS